MPTNQESRMPVLIVCRIYICENQELTFCYQHLFFYKKCLNRFNTIFCTLFHTHQFVTTKLSHRRKACEIRVKSFQHLKLIFNSNKAAENRLKFKQKDADELNSKFSAATTKSSEH